MRSKRRNQQQLTGPDVLMGMVGEARQRGLSSAACDQLEDMLFRMFGASLDGADDPRNQVVQAPLSEAEACMATVLGASVAYAYSSGDEQTLGEVVRVGVTLAARFDEFAAAG